MARARVVEAHDAVTAVNSLRNVAEQVAQGSKGVDAKQTRRKDQESRSESGHGLFRLHVFVLGTIDDGINGIVPRSSDEDRRPLLREQRGITGSCTCVCVYIRACVASPSKRQ